MGEVLLAVSGGALLVMLAIVTIAAIRRKRQIQLSLRLLTMSKNHLAHNIQRELENAGIPVKTFAGKLDFHAMRTTYDSLLFESGASVKEAMSLARHKNPTLTLVTYGRARDARLRVVADALGGIVLGD